MRSEATKQARPASEMLCYKALRQYYQSHVYPLVERLSAEARQCGLLQKVTLRNPEEVGDEIPILLSFSAHWTANCCTLLNERSCLVSLYRATNGDNWRAKTNWCSKKRLSQWYGVEVNGKGHVTKLSLKYNNLTGSLPKELGQLAALTTLTLDGNQLTGILPEEWGQLASLKVLSLTYNQLTGILPVEWGQLA